jgi:hypothetical protein
MKQHSVIKNFRSWKSGKKWLYASSVFVLAIGGAIEPLAMAYADTQVQESVSENSINSKNEQSLPAISENSNLDDSQKISQKSSASQEDTASKAGGIEKSGSEQSQSSSVQDVNTLLKDTKTVDPLQGIAITTNFSTYFYPNSNINIKFDITSGNVLKKGDQITLTIPDIINISSVKINGLGEYGTFAIDNLTRTLTVTFSKDLSGIPELEFIVNMLPSKLGDGAISGKINIDGIETPILTSDNAFTIHDYNYEDRSSWIIGGDSGTINDNEIFNNNYLGSHTYLPNQTSMIYYVNVDPSGNQSELTGRKIVFTPDKRTVSSGVSINPNNFWVSQGPYSSNPQYVSLNDSGWNYTVASDGTISVDVPDGKQYSGYTIVLKAEQPNINKQADVFVTSSASGNSNGGVVPQGNSITLWGNYQTTNTVGFIPTLNASDKTIKQGTSLNDINEWLLENVTATDIEDGAISDKVTIKDDGGFAQNLTNHKNGPVTVTYKVSDSDGNVVTATAVITIYSDITVHYQDSDGSKIKDDVILSGDIGDTYKVDNSAVNVGGFSYDYVSATPDILTGNYGEGGQPTDITLTYTKNEQHITGSDFSMYVGDPTPTVSDFKGSATDKTGADSEVTLDLNGADLKTPGVYTVVLKSADGQTKEVKLTVKANGQSITGSDFSMYVGDPTPTVSDFKGSATDKTGAASEVTVDLNGADLKTAGVYTVVLKSADGQTKEVKLTVKANGQSITGSDFSMYVGGPTPTVSDFKGSATDKTGAASEVTVDLNGADLKTAGVYTVVLKSADGQTKEVKLTVKANGQSITGSDFSMYVGGPTPTVSDFKGSATDKTGAASEVTVDLNGADLKTAGVYTVVLKSADGQTKEVKLTVKALVHTNSSSLNHKDPINNSLSSNISSSKQPLPQTGDASSVSVLATFVGVLIMSLVTLLGVSQWKKRD